VNRAARASIDTAALRANLAVARKAAAGARVMAVIKANAYGHGRVPTARALGDADAFGVARMEEAAQIRRAGLTQRLVLLEGVFHAEQMGPAAQLDAELVVHASEQVEMLEQYDGDHRFPVWLKIDTGMNRLGFPPGSAPELVKRLSACAAVAGQPRLMTHLASADVPTDPETPEQIERFAAVTAGLRGERTVANSAGLLAWPGSRLDWVRPGIMLYGVSPFEGRPGAELGLRPVMSLASELIAIKTVPAGGRVGYGGMWTASKDTSIGVAAIGYGDGYTRHLGSGTPVMVRGRPASLVGRVSMDLITIDLEGIPDARVGDEVLLWGESLPVERLAKAAGTIPYELLCGVTQRVAMRVI
jgi:alanine racemase